MDFKKIGISALCGFIAMSVIGGITFELFHKNYMGKVAEKFPDVLQFPPDMAIAMLGGVFYIFVMAIIYDKMGVDSVESGAITGAWFGAAKWTFINTQWMAMMPNIFQVNYVLIDVALSAIMYGVSGAAMGWALDRFKS